MLLVDREACTILQYYCTQIYMKIDVKYFGTDDHIRIVIITNSYKFGQNNHNLFWNLILQLYSIRHYCDGKDLYIKVSFQCIYCRGDLSTAKNTEIFTVFQKEYINIMVLLICVSDINVVFKSKYLLQISMSVTSCPVWMEARAWTHPDHTNVSVPWATPAISAILVCIQNTR